MYACPWCQKKTFSFWEKQTLGPHKTLECRACRRKVSVAWDRAQLAAIPLIALGMLGLIVGKAAFATFAAVLLFTWVGITAGMMITAPLYHYFVPLVKPE